MKRFFNLIMMAGITSFLLSCVYGKRPVTIETERDIYKIAFKNIDGLETNLSAYKGKKILIVNVASECGHTPQYADLQKLSEKYKDKLVIIGFPCNQFFGQEVSPFLIT
jgi:glutathione peroxidase